MGRAKNCSGREIGLVYHLSCSLRPRPSKHKRLRGTGNRKETTGGLANYLVFTARTSFFLFRVLKPRQGNNSPPLPDKIRFVSLSELFIKLLQSQSVRNMQYFR